MGLAPLPHQSTRRVGVFGGAFDPPHAAHGALARAAVANLQLDELRIVPTGNAWHKVRPLSAAHHRLAMAQLAFSGVPKVVVDPRETLRQGPSYTVDTLRELQAEQPQAALFLIIGEDQARALPSWREWQTVMQIATICVAQRAEQTGGNAQLSLPEPFASRFTRLALPDMPHSATEIRARVAAHEDIAALVIAPVARYIDDHHLYLTS